jgi:hypothetical protein
MPPGISTGRYRISQLTIIEGAGHMVNIEKSEEFNQAVMEWVGVEAKLKQPIISSICSDLDRFRLRAFYNIYYRRREIRQHLPTKLIAAIRFTATLSR